MIAFLPPIRNAASHHLACVGSPRRVWGDWGEAGLCLSRIEVDLACDAKYVPRVLSYRSVVVW